MLLDREGGGVKLLEGDGFALEARRRLAPQLLADPHLLPHPGKTALPGHATSVILLLLPSGSKADLYAAARDNVERGDLLGEQYRGPQRRDDDAGGEPNFFG